MRRLLSAVMLAVTLLIAAPGLAQAADDPDGSIEVGVTIPNLGNQTVSITNGQLRWSLNAESGAGAYYGGCNFLMAGIPGTDGNAGSARVWTEADGLYRATDGAVRIERPTSDGTRVTADWASRCTDRDGVTVTASNNRVSEQQVVIDGGVGTADPTSGTAQIRWSGTFSVVFYGGMSYWWVSDPVLTVNADGTAQLTATASGYGTSMTDTSQWTRLADTSVTLADMSGVELGDQGIAVLPAYRGVAVTTSASATAQVREGDDWGSFPQSFVDFQTLTGQSAYWYSSGGAADSRKPATTVYISYDAANALDPGDDRLTTPTDGSSASSGATAGSAGTSTGTTAGSAASSAAAALAEQNTVTVPAVATETVTRAGDDLIPALDSTPAGQAAVWGAAALLLALSGTIFGFRKGWLVLPWK